MSARVNVVNAFLIADERGIKVTSSYQRTGGELTSAIGTGVTTDAGEQTLSGTLFAHTGANAEGRITEINGFHIEAIPSGYMLVMRNRDVPGVIGRVGTILGDGGVNISRFHLGRRERGGEAMAVIEIDAPLALEILQRLQALEPVISARQIEL